VFEEVLEEALEEALEATLDKSLKEFATEADVESALAVIRVWLSKLVVLERVALFAKATNAGGASVEPLPVVLLIPIWIPPPVVTPFAVTVEATN
jgi:hypothetical protein